MKTGMLSHYKDKKHYQHNGERPAEVHYRWVLPLLATSLVSALGFFLHLLHSEMKDLKVEMNGLRIEIKSDMQKMDSNHREDMQKISDKLDRLFTEKFKGG